MFRGLAEPVLPGGMLLLCRPFRHLMSSFQSQISRPGSFNPVHEGHEDSERLLCFARQSRSRCTSFVVGLNKACAGAGCRQEGMIRGSCIVLGSGVWVCGHRHRRRGARRRRGSGALRGIPTMSLKPLSCPTASRSGYDTAHTCMHKFATVAFCTRSQSLSNYRSLNF